MKWYSRSREDYREKLVEKYFYLINNSQMEEEKLWCLGLGIEDTDYVLCDGDIDILPKLYQKNDIRYEYNQSINDRSQVSCTVFAAIWMLSDLIDYEFSYETIKEVDDSSYDNPKYPYIRRKWHGRYVKYAVDLVKNWYNSSELSKKYWKIAYYRINKYSDMLDKVIELWYTIDGNFCPTSEYSADYRKDAILNWTDFWTNKNGHSIDIINDWKRRVKDSYKGRKTYDWKKDCNRYELANPIGKLTNYWDWFYVYTLVKEDNLERVKELNEFKATALITIENLWKMRHQTKDKWFRDELHETANKLRKKLLDIDEQLKLLS